MVCSAFPSFHFPLSVFQWVERKKLLHDHTYLCARTSPTVQNASSQENRRRIVVIENTADVCLPKLQQAAEKKESCPRSSPAVQCCVPPLPPFLFGVVAALLGGRSPPPPPPRAAAVLQRVSVSSQDCLREIHDFLKKHMDFVSTLLGVTIGFTVAMPVPLHSGPKRQAPVGEMYPKLVPRI